MSLIGKNNEEKIWNFLTGNGLNSYGAAGLMGNLFAESGLNPHNLQNTYEKKLGYTDDDYTDAVDSGKYTGFVHDSAGYGLAQWTFWSRKEALLNYVKAAGASIGDLETQLGFLWKELAESYAAVLAVLKKATSVRQASDAVLLKYEQPKDQSASVQTKRASYGQTYFNKYATKTTNDTQGGKTMSNSSLVDCTVYSPNHSGKRTHSIDRLTPHCVVGQLSAETIGACFPKGRNASCNYGIGYDGRVCLIVDEYNRSWCSSSNANDQRAITIECASDKAEPYAMKSAVYEKLIKLCADICKRNGKTKVLWLGSKEKALAYEPKANEIVLTAHRWFANKSCPGDWLYSRYGELADRINALLGSTDSGNSGGNNTTSGGSGVKYYVQTGAYKQKANADAQLKKVKAAGFDAILKQSGGFYKVQTGAYSKKENANAEVTKLKAKGFDAIVTTNGGSAAGSANSEIKVGDVVQFSGGPHYGSAAASTAAGTPKAGPAKVTRIVKGAKHPYHIVHTDGQSSVYGQRLKMRTAANILLLIVAVAVHVIWIRSLVEWDGSPCDAADCKDCPYYPGENRKENQHHERNYDSDHQRGDADPLPAHYCRWRLPRGAAQTPDSPDRERSGQ